MSKPNAIRSGGKDHLSVIHKASLTTSIQPGNINDAVLQTDLDFNVTGWNAVAEEMYGQPGAIGKNIFHLIDVDFVNGSLGELRDNLSQKGTWSGEVKFRRQDGVQIYFHTTATYLKGEEETPVAILIVCRQTGNAGSNETQLAAVQKKYEILMNTLPEGVMLISADGRIEACNKRGAEILGLEMEDALGRLIASPSWKAIKADGSVFPITEFPGIVSLQTGFPQRNVIIGMQQPNENLVWLSVNSEALIRPGEFDPYAVVVSYSDITESKKTEEELRKSNERFYYVSKVSTDAIWDIDLTTNIIYRSGAFSRLSGYTPEQIDADLNWWFNKVHPEDSVRVKDKLNEHIRKGMERWEDEYRFECADGNYKFLLDSGIILYKGGKPQRMLGAIRDLTEQKKLEKQLLDEQLQRQKAITQATITAQEQEKTYISRELHDNVNQILMSAKLFMDTAKRNPAQSNELLEKAIEYQLLALQEIRKLSKSLSPSNVKTVGLKESVEDIVKNMKLLQQVDVEFIFNEKVEDKLSDDQKLMLFRIIQEQTNNILKYAKARTVQIMINQAGNMIHLFISDDGVGFDTSDNSTKGIGFINIISRADTYNGKVNIVSSPGNGCTLEICFPID
ncbi:MAG: PAS domain S-box protein [Ferruginibacter sp.]|nr:PAS domain S-box protein [Chitinophagaceae bacterium]